MSINFEKLKKSEEVVIEPREIFMGLPIRDNSYAYPRDVQTQVWKQWFNNREIQNNVIKMNTGSGKTVVGLMILQSCLNEKIGPALYVVPDNFLVRQVCDEAKKLGIRVAFDADGYKGEDDYFFKEKESILVTTIHKLVNGKSIFGIHPDKKVEIGSIVIDDVHACLDIMKKQHTISIYKNSDNKNEDEKKESELYSKIIEIFKNNKYIEDSSTFNNVMNGTMNDSYLIPFWIWQENCQKILNEMTNARYQEEDYVKFNLPLMKDNWSTANCVISARSIEITLKGIPIEKITSFEAAKRRIFMSATLSDDSVFTSTIGLKSNDKVSIITPDNANDIGERLIIFPQYLNTKITDVEIKEKVKEISKNYNVTVIVPSFERVKFWDDIEHSQILASRYNNIKEGITKIKKGEFKGVSIFVNKYDGIDLPDDLCRMIIIDGLPKMKSEYDLAVQGMNPNDKRLICNQIQKIEQGMGRGVRSNTDYCAVVLMGSKLADILGTRSGEEYFSSATKKQYNISKKIWNLLLEDNEKPTIDQIFELTKPILIKDKDWKNYYKGEFKNISYDKFLQIDEFTLMLRNAFEMECLEQYKEAYEIIKEGHNKEKDDKTKGVFMYYMCEYLNFSDSIGAQRLLINARSKNIMLPRPIEGMKYSRLTNPINTQAARVIKFMENENLCPNRYMRRVQYIIEKLKFSSDANTFEEALLNISLAIGFESERSEKTIGDEAPDNLIALGDNYYAVIECKNESKSEKISKSDCNQLLGAISWFKSTYLSTEYIPVLVHNSKKFSHSASPDNKTRIITPELLEKLCTNVESWAKEITSSDIIGNIEKIDKLLKKYKLYGKQVIEEYTDEYR